MLPGVKYLSSQVINLESPRVQMYEALRPQFPVVTQVLHAIPDVDVHDLRRLDEKLAATPTRPNKIDKSKRDLLKKITSPVLSSVNSFYRYRGAERIF